MRCTYCKAENPPNAAACGKCGKAVPPSEATFIGNEPVKQPKPSSKIEPPKDTNPASKGEDRQGKFVATKTPATPEGWSISNTRAPAPALPHGEFAPGTVLGDRYEILALLGQGGMGAVYKARDTELDRLVALKIIRPELTTNPEILKRFKQELILARQVTHRNVIRIFDLGQADGFKFITMEYLEGQDLRGVLRTKGKLTPEEAARVILQICRALEAAHGEGVIHRDLKPQNIMMDANGRAYVMDFGIARSAHLPGMTQTGALVGTPEYMSPEQAKGEKLGEQSDIFSLGVILYELVVGQSPYYSETPLATLWKRLQEKARPLCEIDPTIPKAFSDIVEKALEVEPENRFANANEFAQHLESWLGISPSMIGSITDQALKPLPAQKPIWKYTAIAATVLLLAIAGIGLPRMFFPDSSKRVAHAPVSVLVADFTNHTGDPIFEDALEPMFNVALEGASFINVFNRGNARKLAGQLPHPTDKLDEQPARLVAVSQGVSAVVTGELSRRGDKYSLSATALDARTGNVIAKIEAIAANKDEVLLTIPKLAAPIRKALGDTTSESAQLQAAGGAFTAASLEVVHQYGIAMEQQSAGNIQGALQSFSKAAELDPNFARAYSGMSAAYWNLGRPSDAEKYAKLAMQHIDRMTERERYRLRGFYYAESGNWQKCVEEYGELVKRYAGDNIGHNNLATCYSQLRNWPKAVEEARQDVNILPNATGLENLALFSAYGGDFAGGEREARRLQQLMPSFEYGYLALALAQVGQSELPQAAESFKKLATVSPLGASMASSGLADLATYEGRFAEASRILEQGAAADLAAKNSDSAADKFAALAYARLSRGQSKDAAAAAAKALAASQATKIRFLTGRVFVESGDLPNAEKLAAGLASDIRPEPQAYAKIIDGSLSLKRGDRSEAVKRFTDANNLLDTWIGRFELGRAYVEVGAYAEATSEFDRCLTRRGETLALFLDEAPTSAYFPPVYYYRARAEEGLGSSAAADSYRKFLAIQEKGDGGEMFQDAKKRLAALKTK
jgi:tetratricopeptide (TPR) repeat protein/predicted Ser/Thr protein kinase